MFLVSGLAEAAVEDGFIRLVSQWHGTIEEAYKQATDLILKGEAIRITELNDKGHTVVAELHYYKAEEPSVWNLRGSS